MEQALTNEKLSNEEYLLDSVGIETVCRSGNVIRADRTHPVEEVTPDGDNAFPEDTYRVISILSGPLDSSNPGLYTIRVAPLSESSHWGRNSANKKNWGGVTLVIDARTGMLLAIE